MKLPIMTVSPVALRLEEKRLEKGMSHRALGMKSGVNHAYLKNLLEGKSKEPRRSKVQALAAALGYPVDYFYGEDEVTSKKPSSADLAHPKQSHLDGTHGLIAIPELDVRAAAGDGVLVDEMGEQERQWMIPLIDLLAISNNPRSLRIITVEGDSMEPDYRPGEKIVIDTSLRNFTHDGVYVLDFGFGLVVKHLQLVLDSDPKKLLVVSANPIYCPQEITLERAEIKGKVAAKWQRR